MSHRTYYIMGKNTLRELLDSSPERIVTVFTCLKDDLYQNLLKKKIPVQIVQKNKLNEMVESESHQCYVASVKEKSPVDLKEFLKNQKSHSLALMLDSIYDPQNMGAILRAGECFGVDLALFSKNRGTDVTPVVTKTSSGASELVPLSKVSNLAETVKLFQESGYWVVAAEAGPHAKSLYSFEFPEKTLIIMGSEGEGVQKILSKNADFHVFIPMLGKIDSLNVSQATAVLLSHYRSQYNTK